MKLMQFLTSCAVLFFCTTQFSTVIAEETTLLRCPAAEKTLDEYDISPSAIAYSHRNSPPLFWALLTGYKEKFKNLLETGENPNVCGAGISLLTFVASLDSSEYLTLLIKYNVDLNFPLDSSGDSALSTALGLGKYDNAILMLKNGAIPKVMDDFGRTTLFELAVLGPKAIKPALRGKQLALAEKLISAGVDVNSKDTRSGMTALRVATISNNIPLVSFLLKNGANPNLKTNKGQTARDYAEQKNYSEIAKILLEAEEASKK